MCYTYTQNYHVGHHFEKSAILIFWKINLKIANIAVNIRGEGDAVGGGGVKGE